MSDIKAFLADRLDADEALVRGATRFNGTTWSCPTTGVVQFGPPDHELHTFADRDLAGHIVRFSPARVLAEIEAKRVRLRLHTFNRIDGECEHCIEPWPCPDLCLDAAVYADDPRFDPVWRHV